MIEAAEFQRLAANPALNTWLTANAGSGKTRVLTDRVARLLLGGADPLSILCLTYTKAAAAEMQNRLFKTLGGWAMAPDADLVAALTTLGEGDDLSPERLARARQLFAKAIETPGGIRIQTIHSFCASLLRRFPLESGVSPTFQEIDDRSAALLQSEILEQIALGPEAAALHGLLSWSSGEVADVVQGVLGLRADFETAPADLAAALGVPAGLTEANLLSRVFDGSEADLIDALSPHLERGTVTDRKTRDRLHELMPLRPSLATMEALEAILLTGASAKEPFRPKIGAVPTKALLAPDHVLRLALHDLMDRLAEARPDRLALQLLHKTEALHRFARVFLRRYAAAKEARGWLDFDDLIVLATRLLTDPSLSAWVLYRLDGGISHVLVDEAQDTGPAQWRLIQLLTAEFTAGEGLHQDRRTLFVVGDKKQSIYSFQGADVAAFDGMKDRFSRAFAAVGNGLNERPLLHSFRSSPAILRLVDHVFIGDRQAAVGRAMQHIAFRETLPGRVDIWPPVPSADKSGPGDWFDTVERTGADSAEVTLAGQIADEIRALIDRGEQITDRDVLRPVHEGDFLILVRRRGVLFDAVIRACKARGLNIAGADRLALANELAVKDILALLAFLDTQDDDLSLAAALRSPLFGVSEDRLFRLAHGRKGVLWQALRAVPGFEAERAILEDLRNQADFLRPHELIDRLLTRHDGRRRLLARLGEEAADGIDELLSQALAYEQVEVPSLTGFLVWMASGNVEAKRQAESEGRRIRVMTVHGSKGLEAPIVILPETVKRRAPDEGTILPLPDGPPIWGFARENATALQCEAKDRLVAQREAEDLRLLYVALTRARCWLILAAAGEVTPDCWYSWVLDGARQLAPVPQEGGRLRHEFGHWHPPQKAMSDTVLPPEVPDWALLPVPAAQPKGRVFSPSDLGGAKTLPGESQGDPQALARGRLLHQFLERFPDLPADDRGSLAALSPEMAARAEMLLADPALAWVFGPEGQAEIGFAVPWGADLLAGSIDRLVVRPDCVTVVDFKSNAMVPDRPEDVPEGYLRQMGAYAHAVREIYPGRRVEVAILWTEGPRLMHLDPMIVSAALARAAIA